MRAATLKVVIIEQLPQIFGAVLLNLQLMLIIAVGLLVADAAMLFFATQLFERENILTRWK